MVRKRVEGQTPERRREIAKVAAQARWGKVIRTVKEAQGAVQRLAKRAEVSEAEIDPGPTRRSLPPMGVEVAARCPIHKRLRPCWQCRD